MKKSNDLAKNTILLSVGTLFSKGLQFVMIPFVSKWLSTEAYGKFDLIVTYVTLFLPLLSLSTGEAIFRFSASCETKKEQIPYITNGFILTTVNLVVCSLILSCFTYTGVVSKNVLVYFVPFLSAQLFNYYFQAFLRGIKRLSLYTVSNIVIAIMTTVMTVIFVRAIGWGLYGLIMAYTVAYFISDIIIVVWARFWRYLSLKSLSRSIIKELIKYSIPLVPNDVSWWILDLSDRQVISVVLGVASNGLYAIANKIPALCTTIFSMFSISWQQSMVEQIDNTNWPEYANKVYNQMLVVLLTLCSGILSTSFILFEYIFDPKYITASVYVPILITAVLFSVLMKFFGGIQIALKRTSENGITTVIGAIVNLLVDIALIHVIGLYAAAVSTLVANMITSMLRQYRLRKKVIFSFEKKTLVCIAIYIYFLVCSYALKGTTIFKLFNIGIAGCAFIIANYRFFVGRRILGRNDDKF